jgi:ribosomal protein S14
VNASAQSKIQHARDDAMAAERIRQKGYDQEAAALNDTSQDRYKNFEGQQADKSAQLGDYFTGQEVAQPSAEAAIPTTASNITVQEVNKQKGQAKDFTDRTGNALGELRSFGGLLGDVSRLQARDAGTIGQIGGFKKGSSNVLPYELEDANSKGNGLKLFGDILGGVGGIATSAGLSGGSLFGLGKAANTAVSPGFGTGGIAAARAADRASMPGYAGVSSLFGAR